MHGLGFGPHLLKRKTKKTRCFCELFLSVATLLEQEAYSRSQPAFCVGPCKERAAPRIRGPEAELT